MDVFAYTVRLCGGERHGGGGGLGSHHHIHHRFGFRANLCHSRSSRDNLRWWPSRGGTVWDHGRRGKATDRGDGGVVVDIFGGRCRLKGRRTEDIVIRLHAAATAVVVVVDAATAAAVVVVVVAGVRRQDIDDVRVDRGRAERGGGGPEG